MPFEFIRTFLTLLSVQAIRQVMQKRGYQLPAAPAPIPAAAYGQVPLQRLGSLLSLLPTLSGPIHSEQPRIMEDYGQGCATP